MLLAQSPQDAIDGWKAITGPASSFVEYLILALIFVFVLLSVLIGKYFVYPWWTDRRDAVKLDEQAEREAKVRLAASIEAGTRIIQDSVGRLCESAGRQETVAAASHELLRRQSDSHDSITAAMESLTVATGKVAKKMDVDVSDELASVVAVLRSRRSRPA